MEAAVSLAAAWMARSPALLAFGCDSAIELLSAIVVLWRFRHMSTMNNRKNTLRGSLECCYSSLRLMWSWCPH